MEIGFQEMILIGIVLMLFFGPKKLPELGASIGQAIKDFKRTMKDTTSELKEGSSLPETGQPDSGSPRASGEELIQKSTP